MTTGLTKVHGSGLSEDTDRGPSGEIWSKVLKEGSILDGDRRGFIFFDDFRNAGAAETVNPRVASAGGGAGNAFAWTGGTGYACGPIPWKAFATSGVTLKAAATAADDEIGVLQADIDAANDECYLGVDATYTSPFCKISDTAGDNLRCAMEARVRFTKVDSAWAFICGLRDHVDAATLDVPDGSLSIKVEELVGWRIIGGDPDGLDAVHCDAAEVIVQEATASTGATATAATWVKLGVAFDGTKTYWYVNGLCVNPNAGVLPSATNFPDAEPLSPYIGGRCESAADFHFDIDWVKVGAWLK